MRRIVPALVVLASLALGTAHASPIPAATPKTIAPADQARIDAAKKTYALIELQYEKGLVDLDAVYRWSRRWYESEHDAGVKSAGADHLARMKKYQQLMTLKYSKAIVSEAEVDAAAYYVAEAEIWK